MKFKTDHNFYEPTFNALAKLLENDYEILYDSSDEPLGISATVVSKKYKSHGIHIRTYLGEDPEWELTSYVALPLEIKHLPRYKFKPAGKRDGFPFLLDEQLNDLKGKISYMGQAILQLIVIAFESLDKQLISDDDIRYYYSTGFNILDNFDNYGIKLNYKTFLLPKCEYNYQALLGIYNSQNKQIRELLDEGLLLYLEAILKVGDLVRATSLTQRFLTVRDNIIDEFNTQHMDLYIKIIDKFAFKESDERKQISAIITFRSAIDHNKILEDKINLWAFEKTSKDYFLPQTAKDIFLF